MLNNLTELSFPSYSVHLDKVPYPSSSSFQGNRSYTWVSGFSSLWSWGIIHISQSHLTMGTNRKFLWELSVTSPCWWSKTCLHSPRLFCFQMQPYVILHGSVSFPRLWVHGVDKTAVILICPVMRVLCLAISHLCGMNRRQINLCEIKRRKISSNHFRTVPGLLSLNPSFSVSQFWPGACAALGQGHQLMLWVMPIIERAWLVAG